MRNEYPFTVNLSNGEEMIIDNVLQNNLISRGLLNDILIQNDLLIIKKTNSFQEIKLYGWQNGDVLSIFFENAYKFLNVKDKIVIDIGANIADTAIFFSLMGAKKIIALEPSPKIFDYAKRNIELNNVADKVNLFLAGCSKSKRVITLDYEKTKVGYVENSNTQEDAGIKVPMMTIEDIVMPLNDENLILKIDCEGCEYENILNTPDEILKRFNQIQIEYHEGYANLKKKLVKCGFKVSTSKPVLNTVFYPLNSPRHHVGYIYAEK